MSRQRLWQHVSSGRGQAVTRQFMAGLRPVTPRRKGWFTRDYSYFGPLVWVGTAVYLGQPFGRLCGHHPILRLAPRGESVVI